jgi:hypothetical protein
MAFFGILLKFAQKSIEKPTMLPYSAWGIGASYGSGVSGKSEG